MEHGEDDQDKSKNTQKKKKRRRKRRKTKSRTEAKPVQAKAENEGNDRDKKRTDSDRKHEVKQERTLSADFKTRFVKPRAALCLGSRPESDEGQISQKSKERGVNLWFAMVDFPKAFDSIEHSSIWNAIRNQAVSEQYIMLLKKMYNGQTATVMTDVESERFEKWKGTKQGDPLSPLLFDSVLHFAVGDDTEMWRQKGIGHDKKYCISKLTLRSRCHVDSQLAESTQGDHEPKDED